MIDMFVTPVLTLAGIGFVAAAVLYVAARFFHVDEDPRIDQVEEILPCANCGACGLTGCRAFAEEVTRTDSSDDFANFYCPVGGSAAMEEIANLLGHTVDLKEPTVAALKCQGSKQNAPPKVRYDGEQTCLAAHMVFSGESGCPTGCLGLADCVGVCDFDALYMDEETGLPVVRADKCTSCGACVKTCPRGLFDIIPAGKDDKRVYVACKNHDKGGVARKYCKAACIACMRCTKVTGDDKVQVTDNLSVIDTSVDVEKFGPALAGCCPTNAIVGVGFKAEKPKKKAVDKEALKAAALKKAAAAKAAKEEVPAEEKKEDAPEEKAALKKAPAKKTTKAKKATAKKASKAKKSPPKKASKAKKATAKKATKAKKAKKSPAKKASRAKKASKATKA